MIVNFININNQNYNKNSKKKNFYTFPNIKFGVNISNGYIDNSLNIGLNNIKRVSDFKKGILGDILLPLLNALNKEKSQSKIPNGICFFGPIGTGKTFLASKSLLWKFEYYKQQQIK